ncbi:MAG: EAL domain-containing protein [Sideroxyarcus sp.]|nr:EAL domain-containing protein [Sideroxyarcus sp.]
MLRPFEIKKRHVVIFLLLLLLAWVTAAWHISKQHFAHEFESLIEKNQIRAQNNSLDLADSFRRNLHFVAGIPNAFQHAVRVGNAVNKFGPNPHPSDLARDDTLKRWAADPVLNDLNAYLELIQGSLGIDLIYVVNAAGDCIAASNWNIPGTPIGTNFADRQWFAEARNGRRSMQHAMGQTTNIPGLYFSAPIEVNGRFMGALVSKIDLNSLSFLTSNADAYVSDSNGVVILAHDPAKLMMTVANATVDGMSTLDKLSQYQKFSFSRIGDEPWKGFPDSRLQKSKGDDLPHILASTALPEYGLTVHTESDLTTFPLLERQQQGYFALIGLLGCIAILIAGAVYFYLRSVRKARNTLMESEERLKLLLSSVNNGIWGLSTDGKTTFVNYSAASMLGYLPDDLIGKSMHDTVHHSHADGTRCESGNCPMHATLSDGKPRVEIDEVLWRKDGSNFPVSFSSYPVLREGVLEGAVVVFEDTSEHRQKDEALKLASSVYQASNDGILVTDENNCIMDVNPAFTRITGYTLEEVRGKNPAIFQSGKHDPAFYEQMWQSIHESGHWQGEVWDLLKNGNLHAKWLSISVIRRADGSVFRYVGQFSDITEKKRQDDLIWAQANFDMLTNLPNRRLFSDRFRQAISSTSRSGQHGALLSLDLDQFKRLNDTFGHSMGDKLLIEVANRLRACVREEDTIARMGGDEFLIVLNRLSGDSNGAAIQAEAIAENIRHELSLPYQLDNTEHYTSSSIGIILFRGHSDTQERLLAHVDAAMYQAKAKGRNTICFFDASMQETLEQRNQLESALRTALERNELTLHYQVQMNCSGRPIGAEALLRWTHPQLGSVPPAQFIPVAEESGLILSIGNWVLQAACAQLLRWQDDPILGSLSIAINVSARQFRETAFVPQVRDVLRTYGIDATLLKLELTESMVLDNIDDSIRKMTELKQLGVKFAMDDFGTGYSSLSYLSRLPISQLKIDQSFVRDITTDLQDAAIVQTIISMARSLGMDVIAEGVETEAQREFLELRGCVAYQGYLYAEPVSIEEFESRLSQLLVF